MCEAGGTACWQFPSSAHSSSSSQTPAGRCAVWLCHHPLHSSVPFLPVLVTPMSPSNLRLQLNLEPEFFLEPPPPIGTGMVCPRETLCGAPKPLITFFLILFHPPPHSHCPKPSEPLPAPTRPHARAPTLPSPSPEYHLRVSALNSSHLPGARLQVPREEGEATARRGCEPTIQLPLGRAVHDS